MVRRDQTASFLVQTLSTLNSREWLTSSERNGDWWTPRCARGRIRTCDLPLRRRLLYPLSYAGRTRTNQPGRAGTQG